MKNEAHNTTPNELTTDHHFGFWSEEKITVLGTRFLEGSSNGSIGF
jgi:hypothetical protein